MKIDKQKLEMVAARFKSKAKGISRDDSKRNNALIIIVTLILAGLFIYMQQADRKPPNFASIESQIREVDLKHAQFNASAPLAPVSYYWSVLSLIAQHHDVELIAMREGSSYALVETGVDGGNLWQGTINGDSDKVLSAGIEIIESVPAITGGFASERGRGVLVVGVYGAPPEKVNPGVKK